MLCDPLAHLLGDGLDRAILKGNLQPGSLHQLRVAGQTGTAHQLEVAFPGILVVLEAQQEELRSSGVRSGFWYILCWNSSTMQP